MSNPNKNVKSFVVIHPNAVGIDIGSMEMKVSVYDAEGNQQVSSVSAFTADLQNLAKQLKTEGHTQIAMEATGSYWIPLFDILEQEGLEVCLINPKYYKNVKAKKTDVVDCQFIQQLHTYGLTSASFIPEDKIRQLRTYVRQRSSLEKQKASSLQLIGHAFSLMNVKLQHIISDLEGVTGMKIIRAIAEGERDEKKLAAFRDKQMKATEEEIAQSLRGHYRDEYWFMLKQSLKTFDFYKAQISECDQQIEQQLQQLLPVEQTTLRPDAQQQSRQKKTKVRKNQYPFNVKSYLNDIAGIDLTAIDGLDENTVLEIISEIGTDMTKWPTAQHFTSWLRLANNKKISGGKTVGYFYNKTDNRATIAFRLAAQSLHSSKSHFGALYRRLSVTKGSKVAIKAIARKLAVVFYSMLRYKVPFKKQSFDDYQIKQKNKLLEKLKKQASKLGLELVPAMAA